MAKVVAITPIQHGTGGEVKEFAIGDTLGNEFTDDELKGLVQNGSAVEIGKGRKYSDEPVASARSNSDEATRLRDQLIAQSLTSTNAPDTDIVGDQGLVVEPGAEPTVDPEKALEGNESNAPKG